MPGNSEPFIDTNVLICLRDSDPANAAKSREVLQAGGVTSVQTLNEITNVMRRKLPSTWAEVREFPELVKVFCEVADVTHADHQVGLEISERYGLQVFGSRLLATASRVGCTKMLSEDMQHDRLIGSLRITNPYLGR